MKTVSTAVAARKPRGARPRGSRRAIVQEDNDAHPDDNTCPGL